jgi:hypothetical protein
MPFKPGLPQSMAATPTQMQGYFRTNLSPILRSSCWFCGEMSYFHLFGSLD